MSSADDDDDDDDDDEELDAFVIDVDVLVDGVGVVALLAHAATNRELR
jgi:hypothetical protein